LAGPTIEEARRLLESAHILREPADFDLLVFFARHPRTLLASESLGALLGYELKDIARSLETLLESGLLKRTQTSAHAARLYVFATDAPREWLPPLLKMAATRTGRVALRQVLADRPRERPASGRSSNTEDAARAGQRSVVLRMPSDTHGEQRSDAKAR
jgi:DNA-binding MarR family transcriptional regulator